MTIIISNISFLSIILFEVTILLEFCMNSSQLTTKYSNHVAQYNRYYALLIDQIAHIYHICEKQCIEYIFRVSHILQLILQAFKRGKYLPILHQTTCDNYFVIKCFVKLNMVSVHSYLLNASSLFNTI